MTTNCSLEGKVAIVTGAGVGIGRAIAIRLSTCGAHVIINDIDGNLAHEAEEAIINGSGDVAVVVGSVAVPNTAKEMVKAASDRWGRLDILVNSAGVIRDGKIDLLPDEWFGVAMDVFVEGTFLCIQACTPLMCSAAKAELAAGKRVHRKIVNIASTAGIYGAAGRVSRAAATAAVIGITKTVAREWARFLVNCNAVAPGLVSLHRDVGNQSTAHSTQIRTESETQATTQEYSPLESQTLDLAQRVPPSDLEHPTSRSEEATKSTQRMPLRRIGTPDDVAGAVAFLAGPDSDFITGVVLEVHGGMEVLNRDG